MTSLGSSDSYSFLGIKSGWVSSRFEDNFSRFPYIGAREKLLQMQKEKGLARRVIETVIKRVKITSLLGYITEKIIGWQPPQGSQPGKLAEDLIKVFDEESNKRTITRFLADTQSRCRKRHRYFETVDIRSASGISLFKVDQSLLQNEMVVVSGQLVHRDTITQYNGQMAQTVANLPGEWLLTDLPPHGMVKANTRFHGKVISLVMEKEFSQIFQRFLPFRKDIGWYPYCRVTGFFKEPGYGQSAPSLDMVMAEFKRPKPYQAEGRDYFSFLEGELQNPNWLKDPSDLLCAIYVPPLLAKGSSIENFKADDPNDKTILQQCAALAGADFPSALGSWYANA